MPHQKFSLPYRAYIQFKYILEEEKTSIKAVGIKKVIHFIKFLGIETTWLHCAALEIEVNERLLAFYLPLFFLALCCKKPSLKLALSFACSYPYQFCWTHTLKVSKSQKQNTNISHQKNKQTKYLPNSAI